jgi:E3 ubiquitin-protein ligase BRE1
LEAKSWVEGFVDCEIVTVTGPFYIVVKMATVRKASGDAEEPPSKVNKILFEPLHMGSISTLDEMDVKILQFQTVKLRQRLELRQKEEGELRLRIEQLEKRQTQDDAVLNVMNRYWNQLNEDIRVMLQRFDTETSDESESNNENEATTSFLSEMAMWDKNELDEKLAKKVQVSTRAVTKIVQAFDRLQQRSEKISEMLKAEIEEGSSLANLDSATKQRYVRLLEENKKFQLVNTTLHAKCRTMALKMKELAEKSMAEETQGDELNNKVADLEFELQDLNEKNDKLVTQILEYMDRIKKVQELHGNDDVKDRGKEMMTSGEVLGLQKENEELRELVDNRQKELDALKQRHIQTLQEIDKLNQEIHHLPEMTVMETTEYKCLQSKFSVIYNECTQLRSAIQDVKRNLLMVTSSQMKQTEDMENEEKLCQKKLQTEMGHLEDTLNQVKKEYEMLRLEFEKNAAANEQVAPVHREMRNLITQLQQNNQQIKAEAQRYRTKCMSVAQENGKFKKIIADLTVRAEKQPTACLKKEDATDEPEVKIIVKPEKEESQSTPSASTTDVKVKKEAKKEVKEEDPSAATTAGATGEIMSTPVAGTSSSGMGTPVKGESGASAAPIVATPAPPTPVKKVISEAEAAQVNELKTQLKKSLGEQKEMKLLLDMYKGQSKEQTDRVELMVAEKKARIELEELKSEYKKLQENQKKEDKKKVAEEDLSSKIKGLEERTMTLRRQIANQKQEEEALLNEMDVTGQAFEDMQEQNSRLIQQLREKENANFKLMSDRIKANRVQELLKEEKDMLQENNQTLLKHLEAKNLVIRKLEEMEQQLVGTIAIMEKEAVMRQQAMEMNKRKAIESAQSAADLKLHLEKYHSQMKEAQQLVAEKTSSLAAEAYKTKRYQEELIILTKKLERLKKIEMTGSTDEVVLAEIQEYKDTLTCPSCKVRRKDAVLTKCFHVFCFDCLRTRYETRQRKCPKCNAAFGANDYHRLYLT